MSAATFATASTASVTPEDIWREMAVLCGVGAGIDHTALAVFRRWSPNTRSAFRYDLMAWWRWCGYEDVHPADASDETMVRWVRALGGIDPSAETVRTFATIQRYLAHVSRAYRLAGLADPTRGECVRRALKAAKTNARVSPRSTRALRFKGEVADLDGPPAGLSLIALLGACRQDELGLRDAALLRIAYDIGGRRSELVAITVDDICGPDENGAGSLFIPVRGADPAGAGVNVYLSPPAMGAIARWRAAAKIDSGALFRRIFKHFDGSFDRIGDDALHPRSVTVILKRLVGAAADAGLLGELSKAQHDELVATVSSHSIRIGVAHDNFVAGEGLVSIMETYRWKDPKIALRYSAKLIPTGSASARLAKRFET